MMYCNYCGAQISPNSRFCKTCGRAAEERQAGSVGYSDRINDPAFAKYLKNTSRWAMIFSFILAAVAIVGFFIAGEMGVDGMENPQALLIGLGVGTMFVVIALGTIAGRKASRTWDGIVIDKTVKKKTRQRRSGNEIYTEYYTEYVVLIQAQDGKAHRIKVEDNDIIYNYYQIGDHVRHHAGLNSYEKYDKSKDEIIFCNACATLCDIHDEECFRCKCPLLK